MDAQFRSVDARFRELETNLRAEIRAAEQRLTMRLGGMLAASVGLVGALVKVP